MDLPRAAPGPAQPDPAPSNPAQPDPALSGPARPDPAQPDPAQPDPALSGIVLAAGAGRRSGGPKALVPGWLGHAVAVLDGAGCRDVVVVLGAGAERAAALVPAGARAVVAADWAEGVAASLRTGLVAVDPATAATLVTLVDLPGMPVEAAARLAVLARSRGRTALAQAWFGQRPGHPVLIGAEHRAALATTLAGDAGARAYLAAHGATPVDCADLWDGADHDGPPPPR
ncbi:MAG: NTP transferase domain-containing protein [Microbacteriaceae bacterium]